MTELFVIAGPAGSGKSTLGVALADRLQAPYLDLDDATEALVGAFRDAHPDLSEAQALAQVREDRYSELARQARAVIADQAPQALVLIAPFTAEIGSLGRWLQWIADLGESEGSAHLVWLALAPGERRARMAARGATRDADLLEDTGASRELPPAREPAVDCLVIDALLPTATEIDLVVQRFGNGPV